MPQAIDDGNSAPWVEYESADQAVRLGGHWNLSGLARHIDALRGGLERCRDRRSWDLREVTALDSAGAVLLWQLWGSRLPRELAIHEEHRVFFRRLADLEIADKPPQANLVDRFGAEVAARLQGFTGHALGLITMIGQLVLDLGHGLTRPAQVPWREISAHITHIGVRAMPITALVGLLIGVVLSYLSALQLKMFGAQTYIVDILALSITRELGPMLAAILVAGRSGSAITAQLGIMRVTQELDALTALGISHSMRLILPRVIALMIALPLIVVWTDAMALIGGMISANINLDFGYLQFIAALPEALPIANFWIGVGKGAAFGLMIAVVACHYGLRIQPNTESLGAETTNAVVTAITLVILLDAVFAIALRNVGL